MEGFLKVAAERGKLGNLGQGGSVHDKDAGLGVMELETNEESEQLSTPSSSFITVPKAKQNGFTSTIPVLPISFISPFRGMDKAQDASQTMNYEPVLPIERPSQLWKGSFMREVFARRNFIELPSKSTALVLIGEAFRSFNSTFTIFNQENFLETFHDRYSESSPSDPGWWACLNVVLALAHRFRAMRTLESHHENSQSCGHMQNALAVVSELTMLHNSLSAVQALVGMAIVLQGTPNPRLCSVLIAAAMKLAQTMGLHRKNEDPTLSEAEIEQRKRVFWITYILDKDISLRSGQPPSQDDDDMDVELPSETISDLPPSETLVDGINFFNCRIGLAIIQGQVYKRLYSVKAARQSVSEQLFATYELNATLAAWRKNVLIDFDDETMTTLQAPIALAFLHKIILRFTYVNCLIAIHRPFPQNSGSIGWDEICVTEARKAVRLIDVTPRGDYASAWCVLPPSFSPSLRVRRLLIRDRLLIHYFFAAVTTILHAVVLNPTHLFARSDVKLVEPFLGLLELLAREGKSEEVQRMSDFCQDLNTKIKGQREEVQLMCERCRDLKETAEEAVRRANSRMLRDGKEEREEEGGGKESLGDFIWRVECQSMGCPSSGLPGVEPEVAAMEQVGAENWVGFVGDGFNTFDTMVE